MEEDDLNKLVNGSRLWQIIVVVARHYLIARMPIYKKGLIGIWESHCEQKNTLHDTATEQVIMAKKNQTETIKLPVFLIF